MAHDDIDQIAASSRLSVHDPKSTNAIGNPNMAEDLHTRTSHTVGNEKIINSVHQKKGSSFIFDSFLGGVELLILLNRSSFKTSN